MRKITIVGAGQAGLQLGIGLIDHGFDVTLVSNRTGDQIREGRVMSSQAMFGTALAHERNLGLDFWGDACPSIAGLGVSIADGQGGRALSFDARLEATARSIDQRVKMPLWMGEFARRGGRLELCEAGVEDLERYAAESDLVIVAAGKGEIAGLFERDAMRSPYDAPQRALALAYVTGMAALPDRPGVSFNVIPGVGEYFTMPSLTTSGPCDIMFFEGVPGGPLDCFDGLTPTSSWRSSRSCCGRTFRGRPSAVPMSRSPTGTAPSRAASRRPSASPSPRCPPARRCSASPTSSSSTTRSPARGPTTPRSARPPTSPPSWTTASARTTPRSWSWPSAASGTTRRLPRLDQRDARRPATARPGALRRGERQLPHRRPLRQRLR